MNSLSMRALRFVAPGTHAYLTVRAQQAQPRRLQSQAAAKALDAFASGGFLRLWADVLTAALMYTNFMEFYSNGARYGQGNGLSYLYLTALSAYVGDKALGQRAADISEFEFKKRQGWLFVSAWILLSMVLFLIAGWNPARFKEPHSLMLVTGGVIGIFLGSVASKRYLAKLQGDGGGTSAAERLPAEEVKRRVLDALAGVPEGLNCSELAERCGAHRNRVRRALQVLEKEGKVVKVSGSASPNDPTTKYRLAA